MDLGRTLTDRLHNWARHVRARMPIRLAKRAAGAREGGDRYAAPTKGKYAPTEPLFGSAPSLRVVGEGD